MRVELPLIVMNLVILCPFVLPLGRLSFDGALRGGFCVMGAAANAAAETPKCLKRNRFPLKGRGVGPKGETPCPQRGRRLAARLEFQRLRGHGDKAQLRERGGAEAVLVSRGE